MTELQVQMVWEYGPLAAEVYELDKPVGRPCADVEYYSGLLADVRGPILEPATGTGRVLIPLLEAGHEVEGLDSSPQMLARCRQHCRDRGLNPVLREADMTIYVRLAAYEAVIIPAGSIALLDGREATLQALTCFRDSLVPGGHLFVDVPVPRPAATREGMRYWPRGSYLWTLQTLHTEYDPVASQTTRFLRHDKWQDGTLRMTELQAFRLQHWTSQEFADLLAEAGFSHILVTADYQDTRAPGTASDVWTFQATTPQARAGGGHHLLPSGAPHGLRHPLPTRRTQSSTGPQRVGSPANTCTQNVLLCAVPPVANPRWSARLTAAVCVLTPTRFGH